MTILEKKLESEKDFFLSEDFLKKVKKIFMAKEGGVPEAILFILSCIKEGRYTTSRWINFVLREAGIERENSDIRYTINRMKRKKPYIRKMGESVSKVNTYPTIESVSLVKGDKDFVDVNDHEKIRWKITYKIRLNKYGEQKVKEIKNLL